MEATAGEVRATDRSQILDAVIQYGSEMIVVVETKRWEEGDLQSLSLNFGDAADELEIVENSIPLSWGDLVADFNALLERDLVGGAERAIVSEFVDFVEDVHPQLGSFRKLGECGDSSYRINRRIQLLLRNATDQAPRVDKYGPLIDLPPLGGVAQHLYLWCVEEGSEIFLDLSVFPADTLSQARSFYPAPHAGGFVKSLLSRDEWIVKPNFHLGHMQTGMVWTHAALTADEYIEHWIDEIGSAHALARDEWDAYLVSLGELGIANDLDREEFSAKFHRTARKLATPRPGLSVTRRWNWGEAIELDATLALEDEIRAAYEDLLRGLSP